MPSRPKRAPPLVTISSEAWRVLVDHAVAKDVEQWGLLCGRRTREKPKCFRVSATVLVPATKQTKRSVTCDAAVARKIEERLRASTVADNPVGSWHSHIWPSRCSGGILPQLSDKDKRIVLDNTFCVIVATWPLPEDPMKIRNHFSIRAEASGKICRAEAWLRVGDKFRPCEIKVR